MIPKPTAKHQLNIRLMLLIGSASMVFLWYQLLQPEHIGYPPLYWALMFALLILCLKVLHEWYHYYHIAMPAKPQQARTFTVDVFTTFCPGEPYEMIENTLRAIQQIRYPHTTYLCDEANDPYLIELCRELGVRHVTRDNRIDAKAGNINNALKQSHGEICLILDPDHVPSPDFLDEIVPHFQDERIGYVQTVQAYENIHESLISKGAAQQTFQFYGPMMMCMNSYGTVQAIGANCTFRRKALDSIGGHAAGLAEDMHTAMKLHAKGWKSVYVPKVLARGLVPSTLSAYYKQQLKWSRGVFELLLTTYRRIFWKLSWRQRLHYGVLPGFYLISLAYLLNFSIPIIALLSGYMPMRMDLVQFLLIGMPLFVSSLAVRHYSQNWLMEERERGFHLVGGLLLIGTWWIHLLGFVFALLRRKVPYDPTPKDDKEANNWPLNIPNLLVMALSLSALSYGLYWHPNVYYYMMGSLALANVLILSFTVLASRQQSWRRVIDNSTRLRRVDWRLRQARRAVWLFNHRVFSLIRKTAFPLVFLVAVGSVLALQNWPAYRFRLVKDSAVLRWIERHHPDLPLSEAVGPQKLSTAVGGVQSLDILKPARVLYPENVATYRALYQKNGGWHLADSSLQEPLQLEWFLLRKDEQQRGYRFAKMGEGPAVSVEIPGNTERFRLLLKAQLGQETIILADRLRTPFPPQ